jgi:hypothetical protein
MSKLIYQITSLISKLVTDLENDVAHNQISLKDKKLLIDLITKLFPTAIKLQKMKNLDDSAKKLTDDWKIIGEFLERKGKNGSERGI